MNDLEKISEERESVHGRWEFNGAITDDLLSIMEATPNWRVLQKHQRSSLRQVAAKLSRMLSGDPNHPDHYLDAMNYLRIGFEEKEPNNG